MAFDNVTIYPNVHIGKNVTIFPGAVVGRLPMANNNVNRALTAEYLPSYIGDNVIIGANSVIYTGVCIKDNVLICDLASIREGCVLEEHVVLGRSVLLGYDVKIGARSRVMDAAVLGGGTILEEDVFFAHMSCTAEDMNIYLSRFGIVPTKFKSPIIKKKSLIGANATIMPNLEIGEGAVVASGSVVTKTVLPYTMVRGIPAVYWKDVSPADKESVMNETWLKK